MMARPFLLHNVRLLPTITGEVQFHRRGAGRGTTPPLFILEGCSVKTGASLALAWLPRDFVKKLKNAGRSRFLSLLVGKNVPVLCTATTLFQIARGRH